MEGLQAEIIDIAITIITLLVGVVAGIVTKYLKRKGILVKLDTHKELAKIVVSGIEQAYKDIDGNTKLSLAKDELIKIANERGVKIKEEDLRILIENAVREVKKEYNENK